MIDKIKVLHRIYNVISIDVPSVAKANHYGRVDMKTQEMFIDMNSLNNEIADTLLYETLHAIISTMNIKVQDEENVICSLSHGLTTIFNDNPKFLENIAELLKVSGSDAI